MNLKVSDIGQAIEELLTLRNTLESYDIENINGKMGSLLHYIITTMPRNLKYYDEVDVLMEPIEMFIRGMVCGNAVNKPLLDQLIDVQAYFALKRMEAKD